MAFFEKISKAAKNLGDKTGDAIETTKLNNKISGEEKAISEEYRKIGEYYYSVYASGQTVAEEVAEFCANAGAHHQEIERLKAEIDKIKADSPEPAAEEKQPASAEVKCPGCGNANPSGTKFCRDCGTKLEMPEKKKSFCRECGAEMAPGVKFCPECGCRQEG